MRITNDLLVRTKDFSFRELKGTEHIRRKMRPYNLTLPLRAAMSGYGIEHVVADKLAARVLGGKYNAPYFIENASKGVSLESNLIGVFGEKNILTIVDGNTLFMVGNEKYQRKIMGTIETFKELKAAAEEKEKAAALAEKNAAFSMSVANVGQIHLMLMNIKDRVISTGQLKINVPPFEHVEVFLIANEDRKYELRASVVTKLFSEDPFYWNDGNVVGWDFKLAGFQVERGDQGYIITDTQDKSQSYIMRIIYDNTNRNAIVHVRAGGVKEGATREQLERDINSFTRIIQELVRLIANFEGRELPAEKVEINLVNRANIRQDELERINKLAMMSYEDFEAQDLERRKERFESYLGIKFGEDEFDADFERKQPKLELRIIDGGKIVKGKKYQEILPGRKTK
ncbi:hypothetical protein ACFL52_01625 [Candidatus Margulisiibacteriota bacterium]